ncbi:MAG: M20/M25/M40 family metallo-hydrolase [Vicinamibacterales bacterium]
MTRRLSSLAAAFLLVALPSFAQTTATSTRGLVTRLASDDFQGRQAGSQGEQRAANYIQAQLARIGAKPMPGTSTMFLPFEFTAGSRDAGSTLAVTQEGRPSRAFRDTRDVQVLSFSDNGELSAPLVFAGYGIVVPESQNFGYDSYATLDVKDKVVVVLRYFPEDAEAQVRATIARYSDLRYKAQAARQRGARALIVVTGPRSPNAGETVPMSFDTALAGSGIPAVSVGARAADALFAGAPKSLADIQKELDSGNPHVVGFPLVGSATLKTAIVRQKQTARNVVAYLPATAPAGDKPWIIVGAHYDHLGRGDQGTSLAAKEDTGMIHHGADDNASGTAAVLAIAESLAKQPRSRNIAFALWSAEEIGLVGSNAFVNAPPVPVAQMAAYFNFDMVGRMQQNKLIVQAAGTATTWPRILERANVSAGFDLIVQEDPYQPTDVASFNLAGVPSLSFTTGAHPDYHKPSDTADKIAYEDLDRLIGFAAAIVDATGDAAAAPQFVKVDQPQSRAVSSAGLRLTTGTIPDYTSEVKGLLLGGVVGGGPAEQAGLMKGDVIVEIAGQSIANIYDYTFALELLKVNQSVKVVYMRSGMRIETSLTPAARR